MTLRITGGGDGPTTEDKKIQQQLRPAGVKDTHAHCRSIQARGQRLALSRSTCPVTVVGIAHQVVARGKTGTSSVTGSTPR